MEAVQQNGLALETASYELRADKEVCLIAAKQNIHSLAYADDSVKNEADFMLKIVEINAEALVYASESVRSNSKIVFTAVKQLGQVFPELEKQQGIIQKIIHLLLLVKQNLILKFHLNQILPSTNLLSPERRRGIIL